MISSVLPTTLLLPEEGRRSKSSSQQHTVPDALPMYPYGSAPLSCPVWGHLHPPGMLTIPKQWGCRQPFGAGQGPHVQLLLLWLGVEGAGRSPSGAQVSHGHLCYLEPETPLVCAATPWCGAQGCFSMVGNSESCYSCESLKFPPRTLAKWFPPLLLSSQQCAYS